MTVAPRVTRTPDRVAALAVSAGLGLLGALLILGSRTQWLLVLAPIGAVVIVIAARSPVLALNVMVVTEITNLSGVLAPVTGLPLFQASMLLGLVSIGLALRDPRARARLNTWTVICVGVLGAYLVIESISVLGSVDLTASLGSIRRTGVDCLFAIIVFVLIQITGRPWMAAAAIVAPLAVLSALTLINQVVFGGAATFGGFATVTKASGEMVTTLRYGGPLPDSNFWGRHLVLGVPLGAALLTRAIRGHRYLVEVGWAAALLAIFAGIYLTQSRGTFVSAGVAVLVWFVLSGRPVWKSAPIMVPLAIGVALIPGVGNRLVRAVVELSQGQGGGFVDPSLLGRLAAQQQAAMMWQERPVFGFGPGTFPDQVPEFAGRVPTAVRQPAEAPHNIYFELAAESGTLGVISWLLLIVAALTILGLRICSTPRAPERILAAAVFAAIVGWSVSSLALHLAYFRTFALILALAGGLAPAWPVAAGAVRRYLDAVAACVLAAVIGGAMFAGAWVLGASRVVAATQHTTVTPVGPIDGWYAYALDIRSRVELLPTMARLVHERGSAVEVQPDPVRGLLDFTATGATETEAKNRLRAGVERAGIVLGASIGYNDYILEPVGTTQISAKVETTGLKVALATAVGGAAALISGVVLVRQLLPRPEDDMVVEPVAAQVVSG